MVGQMSELYRFFTEFSLMMYLANFNIENVFVNFGRSLNFGVYSDLFVIYAKESDELAQAVKKLRRFAKCFYIYKNA